MQVAAQLVVKVMLGLPIAEACLTVVLPKQRFVSDVIQAACDECNGCQSLLGREIVEDLMDQLVGQVVEGAHDDNGSVVLRRRAKRRGEGGGERGRKRERGRRRRGINNEERGTRRSEEQQEEVRRRGGV